MNVSTRTLLVSPRMTSLGQCYLRLSEIEGSLAAFGVPMDHDALDFIRELIEALGAVEKEFAAAIAERTDEGD